MTERPGMSGDPDADPYRHLFRDEPPTSAPMDEPVGEPEPTTAEPVLLDEAPSPDGAPDPDAPRRDEARGLDNALSLDEAPGRDEPVLPDAPPLPDDAPKAAVPEGDAFAPRGPVGAAVETDESGDSRPQPVVDEASDPAPPRGQAETGRLFRSAEADPATGAIPALRGDQRRKLRTVGAQGRHTTAAVVIDTSTANAADDGRSPYEPLQATADSKAQARERLAGRGGKVRKPKGEKADKQGVHADGRAFDAVVPSGPGLRAIGVFVVVIAVTLLLGLVDVLIGPGLGPIFGVGLLVSSAYAAFAVRRDDALYAVTAPPIAAFLAVITVGQLNAGASVDSLSGRAIVAFFALADNWLWIIGSTLLALAIVLVRGLRAKRRP